MFLVKLLSDTFTHSDISLSLSDCMNWCHFEVTLAWSLVVCHSSKSVLVACHLLYWSDQVTYCLVYKLITQRADFYERLKSAIRLTLMFDLITLEGEMSVCSYVRTSVPKKFFLFK